MTFQKGSSGNPSGRPPGIVDRRSRMAKAFAGEYDAIVAALVQKAKAGDVSAASLYLSRVEPPLRPQAERVHFQLDPQASLSDQASAVLLAVSRAELDPDTAKMLIDCIAAAAGLRKFDEFAEDLRQLRTMFERSQATGRSTGGVAHFDATANN